MGYTREQILEQCRNAFQNKNTFYKKEFIKMTIYDTQPQFYKEPRPCTPTGEA